MQVNGAKIRELRDRKAMSQKRLAEAAGIGERTVQDAEEKWRCSPYTKASIARALEVEPEVLTPQASPGPNALPWDLLQVSRRFRRTMSAILTRYYRLVKTSTSCLPDHVPVLCPSSYCPGRPVPLTDLDQKLAWQSVETEWSRPDFELSELLELHDTNSHLHDGYSYRLLSTDGRTTFTFCPGSYYGFLDSCEYLGYEAFEAVVCKLLKYGRDSLRDVIDVPSKERDLRHQLRDKCEALAETFAEEPSVIPTRSATGLFDFGQRHTAFGTATLVVLASRNNPPRFFLNKRTAALAETPNLLHVIPAGTFQPIEPQDRLHGQEFSFTENVIREFAEELLGEKRVEGQSTVVLPMPEDLDAVYSKKARRFRSLVREEDATKLLYLGLLVDPVNLKPEIATVLILDQDRMEGLELSWESRNLQFYDFTKEKVERLLEEDALVPTGVAILWLVLEQFDDLANRLPHP